VVFHNNVIDADEWPRVSLLYELSRPAQVSVKVSTRTGEPVRTLFEGERPAGRYLPPQPGTEWDGRNDKGEAVPNGMYVAKIRMPDKTYTCTVRVQR